MNIMLCVVRRFVTLLADVAIICLLLLRKRRRPMVVAATAIVAMLLAAGANGQLTPQTFYHVTDLGTPSGWGGYGINDGGEVVVGSLPFIIYPFVGTGTVPAFLYDGTLHNLGTLGGTQSFGQGINYASHVVGTSSTTGNAAYHAFLYDGTMHDLGTLGGVWSLGYGINDAGYAVGVSYITGNAASHAFLYDGTMHDLGTLGGTLSSASAINNGGLIVGRSSVAGNASSHAFLYDGTMHDLGTLGGTWSEGNDINNVGQGVGSAYSPGDVAPHAFLYDGAMHDLGTLGGTWSYGYGINDAGQVVGSSAIVGDAAQHAYLYDGAMQDLNALIVSPDDWTLTRAMDINNAGQITGTGELNSQEHAVLLSPSTGASAWLSIDTTQSFLTLTGDIDGQAPITEQSPGSLTTALAGTLQADLIGITGAWSDIRLSSANDIHPLGNPGPFQPGNAPADLAGLVNLSEIVGDELFIFAAFRNSVLGVSSRIPDARRHSHRPSRGHPRSDSQR